MLMVRQSVQSNCTMSSTHLQAVLVLVYLRNITVGDQDREHLVKAKQFGIIGLNLHVSTETTSNLGQVLCLFISVCYEKVLMIFNYCSMENNTTQRSSTWTRLDTVPRSSLFTSLMLRLLGTLSTKKKQESDLKYPKSSRIGP